MLSDQQAQKMIVEKAIFLYGKEKARQILQKNSWKGRSGLRKYFASLYPDFFCKIYLHDQFERDFADYSLTILNTIKQVIESDKREKQCIIAPREHGKSTFTSFAMPLWATLFQKKKFIFFISSNIDIASNFMEKIKREMVKPEIIEDFGDLKGTTWNADTIQCTNGTWLACSGWKAGLRGINKDTRPDLILIDDLEDKNTMESESLRQKLESCFNEEIGRLGTFNTDFFYIGTLLSEDSLLAKVSQMPSWETTKLKRVISFPNNEQLWEEWRKIYRDMKNENRFDDAWEFYFNNKEKMLEGAKVLWENKVPPEMTRYAGGYYNVMLDRECFGEDAFWKEDQNEPRNSDDLKFKEICYWTEFPEQIKSLKLAIDPSEGKSDSSCYVVGGEYNGGFFIRDAKIAKHNPYKIMQEVVNLIKEYPSIDEVILESNLFRDLLKTELIKVMCENDVYRTVTCKYSNENKHIRIMKIEPDIISGKVLFNEINVQFNDQIKNYHQKMSHDDAADALQLLLAKLKKPKYYFKIV